MFFLTNGVASHYEVGLGRAGETRDKLTLYVTGWTCSDQEVGSVSVPIWILLNKPLMQAQVQEGLTPTCSGLMLKRHHFVLKFQLNSATA